MSRVSTAGDGVATPAMADYYAEFAHGGFGLIVSEGTYFDATHSQAYPDQPAIVTDEQVRAWARVVEAVHAAGGDDRPAAHARRRARPDRPGRRRALGGPAARAACCAATAARARTRCRAS